MLPLVTLLCTDEPFRGISIATQRHFQTLFIQKVFLNANQNILRNFSTGPPFETICHWKADATILRVKCGVETGLLEAFDMSNFTIFNTIDGWIGQLDVRFFPNSITDLQVRNCDQKQALPTRSFPKNAQVISFWGNMYFGTPDLSVLPMELVQLNLARNRLSGSIDLCFLPAGMKQLWLDENRLRQKVLWYGNLPENIEYIGLKENSIGSLHAIFDSPEIKDKRVFYGFPHSRIH